MTQPTFRELARGRTIDRVAGVSEADHPSGLRLRVKRIGGWWEAELVFPFRVWIKVTGMGEVEALERLERLVDGKEALVGLALHRKGKA